MRWTRRARASSRVLHRSSIVFLLAVCLSAQTSAPPTPQSNPPTALPTSPPPRPPLLIIDAAHGGAESGAVLGPNALEKDINLAIARRLRLELAARGVQAQLLRDSDATLSTDQRASLANSARPALYLCLHAASVGKGVTIYTAMLVNSGDDSGPFHNWTTAQSASLPRSRAVQQQMTTSIQRARFPVRAMSAPLRPLNNIAVPSIAVEIAPASSDVTQLTTSDYQQMVSAVLATAISQLQPPLSAAP